MYDTIYYCIVLERLTVSELSEQQPGNHLPRLPDGEIDRWTMQQAGTS